MFMGARRRMGSGVPGYSGPALPRSTRSSTRGRAGGSRKVGVPFDWLAEVAGLELLQGSEEQKTQREALRQQVSSGTGDAAEAASSVEDKFIVKDGPVQPRKQEDVKSDNESGTSFALVESDIRKLLNLQCQVNQASHEEEMKGKNKAEAAAAAAAAVAPVVPGNPDGVVVTDKPVSHVSAETGNQAKVKDEECSSECIMSEEGLEKPQKNSRRSRKRKNVSRSSGWGGKRNKHDEFSSPTSDDGTHYKRTVKGKKRFKGDVPFIMPHDLDVDGDCEPPAAAAKLRRAKAASVATPPGSRKTADGHVKVSVKSFTIPELYVDIPESATVGTLKRAVMDAAMNLLGGGLRVCVLVQGRKVPDEAATLSEMGISHGGKSDLGFMLEPTSIPSASTEQDDPLLVLLHAASEPNSRSAYVVDGAWTRPSADSTQQQQPDATANVSVPTTSLGPAPEQHNDASAVPTMKPEGDLDDQAKQNESDSTSTLSQATPYKPRVLDAKAIILHPAVGVGVGVENGGAQGLALVPMRPKSHSLEIHKRRIRRPFSVGEVESLVQAVEQLGTGRWRDVKLQAFENAKHRTYVDLKDKWKTLVHTAQIAPHQRRGDPVPQELLDRVIAANNYWAAHQAKEQAELEA
ncbi:telomere repeat-binding protein 1 isoform X1 [Selaginella moellendorffii]|nr:telomere repeat-binding protein 1 isoform X1 [Selaginella moellendorffii]XP_024545763.1 telomere repeat-binding protein 1 isoform X1 [Selaginella moellendorffii]|eukprot:XP_024545762.1 telomere repeat-binding protein 1 isoform X1 [Selaginella moellendorffii]